MMRAMCRTALPVLLAVVALSAVAAGAAQAATEGPFYKIAGTRLAKGQSKEVTLKANPNKEYSKLTLKAAGVLGWLIQCKTQAFGAGAKLLGSTGASSGSGEVRLELSGCTVVERGNTCNKTVEEPIKTEPLSAQLVYTGAGRTGKLAVDFKPVKLQKFGEIRFPGTEECGTQEDELLGELVAELYSGGAPVEVGKEPAEGKALELHFPWVQPKEVWSRKAVNW